MNVFVLTTGRTGSVTFQKACSFITNFTSSHESRCDQLGNERLHFPDQHIEIDNRLAWFTGKLDEQFGKDAYYVHLLRNEEAVAKSYMKRWHRETSIVRAYAYGILKKQEHQIGDKATICRDFVSTVNTNIRLFLKDKPNVMTVKLENLTGDFDKFWDWIGAKGNKGAAIKALEEQYNDAASSEAAYQPLEKTLRVLKKLPSFIKNA